MKAVANDAIDTVEVATDGSDARQWPVRQVAATLAIVLMLVGYVIVVRASDHVVHFVDMLRRNAAATMLVVAVMVALGWRFVPPGTHRLATRVRGNVTAGPIVVATGLALCITPAMVSWLTASWAYSKIAGVIPWADASAYQLGGLRLLHRGRIEAFNMRRPLNAGFLRGSNERDW